MFAPSVYTASAESFQPSVYSYGAAEKKGATDDPLTLYGIDRLDETKLRKAGQAAEKAMWKEKLGTKLRVSLEKKANELKSAAATAKRVNSSKLGEDPAKLWSSTPKSRLVNFAGVFSNMLGTPSDAILAIAGGAQPGAPMMEGEWRKSILGGLLALQSAGVAGVQTKGLKAPIVGNKQVNEALATAAGMAGKKLEDVYTAMVKRIAGYGPGMAALAWSYRAQLWIADVKGIEAVHAASGAVVALFVPIGTIVGAAIGGHSAITMALAKSLSLKMEIAVKKALPKAQAEVKAKAKGGIPKASDTGARAPAREGGATPGAAAPGEGINVLGVSLPGSGLWWTLGLGTLFLGGIAVAARSRS